MSRFDCEVEGCERGMSYGGEAIYRTSPKGAPFVGRCREHLNEAPDPVVEQIVNVFEDDNAS